MKWQVEKNECFTIKCKLALNCVILPLACFPWHPGAAEPLGKVLCPDYLNSFSHLLYPLGLALSPDEHADRVLYMNELQYRKIHLLSSSFQIGFLS